MGALQKKYLYINSQKLNILNFYELFTTSYIRLNLRLVLHKEMGI